MDMTKFEEILNNSTEYIADGIGSFIIDGVTYNGYGDYTFFWENTLVKQPNRAQDGSMGNLDTVASFVTAHMKATYSIMPITEYRKLMEQYLNKTNEGFLPRKHFSVTCYDPIYDEHITRDMYLATPETPKYVYRVEEDKKVSVIGVENYTVELIGTNIEDNK